MPDLDVTIDVPQSSALTPPPAVQAPADDDFDKERAMETIRKLRDVEKNARLQARELADLKAKNQEREQAELSETDRLKKQLADAQQRESATQARLHAELVKRAASDAATSLQLPFAGASAIDDAVSLGAFTDLEIGDDGKVTGINDAIRALQKARPYLFGLPASTRPPNINAGNRNGGKDDLIDTDAELARKRADPLYS